MVETAVDAILTIDATGLIDSVNPAAARLFGYAAGEMVGRNVRMLMPEPDHSRHDGYLARHLAGGEPRIIGVGREVTGLRKDGSTFPMHLAVGEMTVAGRRMFTGVVRDITERVAAEEALRASEARYRAIVETAVDGIIGIAADGTVEAFNPAAERLFGYPLAEVLGANVRMLMPEPDHSRHDGYLARYLAGGEPRIIGIGREVMGRRRDGTLFPMHLAVSEVRYGGQRRFTGIVRDMSDLRRAERAVEEQRDYVSAIIASMQDGLVVRALDGTISQVNPRFCEITGFTAGELVGTGPPFPFWAPDAPDPLTRLRTSGQAEADMLFRRRDGSALAVIVTAAPVRDVHGDVRTYVETVKDVTGRRSVEQRSEALVAALQDGLIVRSPSGAVVQVNRRFCEMTGFTPEEIVGRTAPLPHWPPGAPDPIDVVTQAGGEVDMTFRARDGATLDVIVTAAPIHDARGDLVMHVETVKDVTARRAAERELAAQRDHAAGIIAALRDGLIVASPSGEIIDANDAFLEMVGRPREEVVGREPPFPWWDPDDETAIVDALDNTMSGVRGDYDLTFRRRSGERFPVRVSVATRHGSSGEEIGLVATYRDMGPWQATQDELRRREAAQAESDALLAAEREAQRLKDEFLAMVSHELRTPLSAVMGYLELAIADVRDPGVRDLLGIAERNSRRLAALVRDLLLVAQAGAGRLSLDRRELPVGDLVEQAIAAARPAALAKGIELVAGPRDDTVIDGDPDRLGQVLDNLITNAVKFSPEGTRVTVDLATDDRRVRISVADEGPGIPDDERDRLFEPFFRARQATADVVPGSGLGLAVVKAIVEAHGGEASVRSQVGGGSVFRVDLPRPAPADPQLEYGATA